MKNLRIKTNPIEDSETYIQLPLDQNFDIIEVLSLNLTQTDVYKLHSSDYGVIAGRCYMNNGLGIPNVGVSIFIPIDDEDKLDANFKEMYPYESIVDVNDDNMRYNLLIDESKDDCHIGVGTFPNKNAILDDKRLSKLYSKYFKYTTVTNSSGDYMFYGVPTGQYTIVVDCDLSDIGPYSQKPYDLIEEGANPNMFESPNQFKIMDNLNVMPHIIHKNLGGYVYPLWGDNESEVIGISRLDIDLDYVIKPKAFFIGSVFSDNEKDSVNKNCRPRKKLGNLCETVEKPGRLEMIRKTLEDDIERFDIKDGDLINDDGTWVYRIPMNLDYMITNEEGIMIPTEDTNRGIPTRAKVRFKLSLNDTGDVGRIRTTAKYLIPHNPEKMSDIDYEFSENTKDKSMADFYWNKIYTVKSFIPRLQNGCESGKRCIRRRNVTAVKDIDDCVGSKNPFPFNKFNGKMNPLFTVLCAIITIIIEILGTLNSVLAWLHNIKILGVRPFRKIRCITITCDDTPFVPGCSGAAVPSGYTNRQSQRGATKECFRILLSEYIKIYTFDFYNDWINGSVYAMLLKYKERKDGNNKFCDVDKSESGVVQVNTQIFKNDGSSIGLDKHLQVTLGTGFIKQYDNDLYYVPFSEKTRKLFAVDIFSLGSSVEKDWQLEPKIHNLIDGTTYIMPNSTIEEDPSTTPFARDDDANDSGLFFDFDCDDFDMNENQIRNLMRASEIGVGLNENRDNNERLNQKIEEKEIENKYVRDALIYLNSKSSVNPYNTITSSFNGLDYENYRNTQGGLRTPNDNSLYFYFGSKSGSSAMDRLNKDYFAKCIPQNFGELNVKADVTNINLGNDGKINLIVEGGISPYFYEWTDGYTTQTRTNLSAGQYKVKIFDSVGNFKNKIIVVTEPNPIEFNTDFEDVFLETNPNGKIIINNINGGRQILVGNVYQYSYKIKISGQVQLTFDNVTSEGIVLSNLSAGYYRISIEDYHQIKTVSENIAITISNPKHLDFKLVPNDINCKDSNDGSFFLEFSSGNPPYKWSVERKVNNEFKKFEYWINESNGEISYTEPINIENYTKYPDNFDITYNDMDFLTSIEEGDKISGEYRITMIDSVTEKLIALGAPYNVSNRSISKTYKLNQPNDSVNLYYQMETINGSPGYTIGYVFNGENDEETIQLYINNSTIVIEYDYSYIDINGETVIDVITEYHSAELLEINSISVIGGFFTTSDLTGKRVYMYTNEGCRTKNFAI